MVTSKKHRQALACAHHLACGIARTKPACYLVVQNADPAKEVIALGRTYFVAQTSRQELGDAGVLGELPVNQKRLLLRQRIEHQNTDLASATKTAGVITAFDFTIFQNHGYRGLCNGLTVEAIHNRKKLKKSQDILDHMGATELAANDTRYQAGVVVRRAITELGGTMPERLSTVDSIKKLERAEKKRLFAPKTKGKKNEEG